jgi:hypothetical protein
MDYKYLPQKHKKTLNIIIIILIVTYIYYIFCEFRALVVKYPF